MQTACACGCGELVTTPDRRGREVRFVRGHSSRGVTTYHCAVCGKPFLGKRGSKYCSDCSIVPCACGCGAPIKRASGAHYKPGHHLLGKKLSEAWKKNIGDGTRGKPRKPWTPERRKKMQTAMACATFSSGSGAGRRNRKGNGLRCKRQSLATRRKRSATIAALYASGDGEFQKKQGRGHKRGHYTSTVTGVQEWYRSSYELARFKQLDALGIVWTTRHKVKVPYTDEKGPPRHYVPDIRKEALDESFSFEEVKPAKLAKLKRNRLKVAAALDQGLALTVITEAEIFGEEGCATDG